MASHRITRATLTHSLYGPQDQNLDETDCEENPVIADEYDHIQRRIKRPTSVIHLARNQEHQRSPNPPLNVTVMSPGGVKPLPVVPSSCQLNQSFLSRLLEPSNRGLS